MPPSTNARRYARKGKGLLPPNPIRWSAEHNALDVREALSLGVDCRLSHDAAFVLLPHVMVTPHSAIPAAAMYVEQLRGASWSGAGISISADLEWVVYNDSHAMTRVRATVMEEFFHIWLEHPRSALRIYGEKRRTFDPAVEDEAYGSGAAALVPYKSLRSMVADGMTRAAIASHFDVSLALVDYRCKVTRMSTARGKRTATR